MDAKLKSELLKQGYYNLKDILYKGEPVACGLYRFVFTTGLVIGMDETGYEGRYCFPIAADAVQVLDELEEIPDDLLIPGDWLKYKGNVEFRNPNCRSFGQ